MFKIRTILAPVDFSARTDAEAENAVNIARHFGAQVIFLHVIPSIAELHPTDPAAVEAYAHQFTADVEKGVEHALDLLIERVASGIEATRMVLVGNPAEKIDEVAMERNADLVVMPTAGRGRIRRHLVGSVTSQVLHDLACPVFTGVHLREVEPTAKKLYRRIACSINPEDGDTAMLRWARDFASAYEGELHAVCILPFLDSWGAAPSLSVSVREEALSQTRERIEQLLAKEGVEAKVTVLGGPLERVIPPFVQENRIDLLITGRRRSQDVVGIWGFHTDILDTIRCSPCPTIVF